MYVGQQLADVGQAGADEPRFATRSRRAASAIAPPQVAAAATPPAAAAAPSVVAPHLFKARNSSEFATDDPSELHEAAQSSPTLASDRAGEVRAPCNAATPEPARSSKAAVKQSAQSAQPDGVHRSSMGAARRSLLERSATPDAAAAPSLQPGCKPQGSLRRRGRRGASALVAKAAAQAGAERAAGDACRVQQDASSTEGTKAAHTAVQPRNS